MSSNVVIIAEAGVNHNGSIETAKKLVDVASWAGADYVKFQTFKSEQLVSKSAILADYQKKNINTNNDSQYEMLKKLELSYTDFEELALYCNHKNIKFLSTAFDLESVEFLKKLGMDFFKIPSGEITNLPYLLEISKSRIPIIISTGMSTIGEVEAAIEVFLGRGYSKSAIKVLHCNTEYPTPFCDVNLLAMSNMKEKLSLEVGYSDHTEGIEVSLAAVALGAKVIEKHFTLDKNLPGPDHKASLNPDELKALVSGIRRIEVSLGSPIKVPSDSEMKNRMVARKSVVAKTRIQEGETFSIDNLTCKRPGTGISPMKYFDIIGKKANRTFVEDELIEI